MVLRLLAEQRIEVRKAIVDGGTTPYEFPYWFTRLILLRDYLMIQLLRSSMFVLKLFFDPKRWTPEGCDPEAEYKAILLFLKGLSGKTIWNIFDSANNYDMPNPMPQRGELMSAHCALLAEESPAEMVAVMGVSQESLQSLLDEKGLADKVYIANINSTQQLILAGRSEDIASFKLIAKEHGIKKLLPLKVEGPFHSPLMEAVCEPFGKVLDGIAIEEGQVPVISNTTLEPHQSATVKDVLVRHLVEPVQWRQTIDYLVNEGITHIVQIGPGNTLAQLLKREENAPQCIVVDKVADVELLKQFIKGENK